MESIISVDLVAAARKSEDIPKEFSDEGLAHAALRYEMFLRLVKKHWGTSLAPSRDIDMMWHIHMLHPRNYQKDCMNLFGDVLDHDGGFGSIPEEEEPLRKAFALNRPGFRGGPLG